MCFLFKNTLSTWPLFRPSCFAAAASNSSAAGETRQGRQNQRTNVELTHFSGTNYEHQGKKLTLKDNQLLSSNRYIVFNVYQKSKNEVVLTLRTPSLALCAPPAPVALSLGPGQEAPPIQPQWGDGMEMGGHPAPSLHSTQAACQNGNIKTKNRHEDILSLLLCSFIFLHFVR